MIFEWLLGDKLKDSLRQIKPERHRQDTHNHRKRNIKNRYWRIGGLNERECLAPESGESREASAETRDKEVLDTELVLMIGEKRREKPNYQTTNNIYEESLNRKLANC